MRKTDPKEAEKFLTDMTRFLSELPERQAKDTASARALLQNRKDELRTVRASYSAAELRQQVRLWQRPAADRQTWG